MSFILRRSMTTMIPPKIASAQAIKPAADSARIKRLADMYSRLPKGAEPNRKNPGLFGWYQAKYFGDNPSPAPFFHIIGFFLLLGYGQDYFFHLRHHKNNAH